jgi:hypothetical protein
VQAHLAAGTGPGDLPRRRCDGSHLPPGPAAGDHEAALTLLRGLLSGLGITGKQPGPRPSMDRWVRTTRLAGDDARLFDRVADLLGPAGEPALHVLAQRIWDQAEDEGRCDVRQ